MDMQHAQLLERMASISPGARLHLTAQNWRLNIDEDEINSILLVNECFSVLIGEAYEIGIEFYCPLPDLCDSFYHLDKVLLLFEVIFPTPLYRSINEDDMFRSWLHATVLEGATTEELSAIGSILAYLALENPATQEIFHDTYDFLSDKISSTPAFMKYVASILSVNDTQFSAVADPDVIVTYLQFIAETHRKLLRACDIWASQHILINADLALQYTRVTLYYNAATASDTLSNYAWVHAMLSSPLVTPVEQALSERIAQEFDSTVPLYDAYYQANKTEITEMDIYSLMLGEFVEAVTKEAFIARVTDLFARLQHHGVASSPELMLKRQTAALVLAERGFV